MDSQAPNPPQKTSQFSSKTPYIIFGLIIVSIIVMITGIFLLSKQRKSSPQKTFSKDSIITPDPAILRTFTSRDKKITFQYMGNYTLQESSNDKSIQITSNKIQELNGQFSMYISQSELPKDQIPKDLKIKRIPGCNDTFEPQEYKVGEENGFIIKDSGCFGTKTTFIYFFKNTLLYYFVVNSSGKPFDLLERYINPIIQSFAVNKT